MAAFDRISPALQYQIVSGLGIGWRGQGTSYGQVVPTRHV